MRCNTINYQKTVLPIFLFIIIGCTVFSCTYEKQQIQKNCTLPDTVSFSRDIQPIFNTNCNASVCHTTATHAGTLSLEAAVAYSRLMKKGSGYVDTLNPQYSILYSKLISESDPMPPPPFGKLDDCKIQLVLKWIQQKAKNN